MCQTHSPNIPFAIILIKKHSEKYLGLSYLEWGCELGGCNSLFMTLKHKLEEENHKLKMLGKKDIGMWALSI
jgi:hypothetical protein